MSQQHLLIVGAALAGLRAAEAARKAGFEGEVTLLGAEEHPPYTRPPLSKEHLAGDLPAEKCLLKIRGEGITLRTGEAATGLDPDAGRVRTDGDELAYDRLILATGSRARRWEGPGADLEGLHVLRTLEDSAGLGEALAARPRLVVLGGGYIGCEVAATARALDVEQVTIVDVADQLLAPLGPWLGERVAALHREAGVHLALGSGVRAVHGEGRVEAVELQDGTRLEADCVVVALGARPNVEWLEGSGLELALGGVRVADTLAVPGRPEILAVGDIAAFPHPMAGGELVRIEHWTNAAEQGAQAGEHAFTEPEERPTVGGAPYVWTDQHGAKLQALGLPARAEEFASLEEDPDGERWVAGGVADGRLVAMVGSGAVRRLAFYRQQLPELPTLDAVRQQLADDDKALGPPAGS